VKSLIRTTWLVAALCLLAWPLQAADGLLLVEKTTTNGTSRTNQIQIEKTRMRADSEVQGQPRVIVFDATTQVLRMIIPGQMTYSEMTKADVDQLGGQMQALMAQMQDQLKNLPEAQRAQVEAMMRGRGAAGAAAPKTEYRKVGTDKVGKWTCDKYEGYINNQKTSELCTVDPKVLGVALTDFDVTKQMAAFFEKLVPQGAGQIFTVGAADQQGFSGVPVRRTYTIGAAQTTTELADVTRQTFTEASYAVPAGFKKDENPLGALGAPGRGQGRGRQ